MSFFSPGHVNGLAQKCWIILSDSGNSLHRKRLFLRAVFFLSFFFFFLEEDREEEKKQRKMLAVF